MQTLKEELEKLFNEDFFPANKSDIIYHVLECEGASKELCEFLRNLEDDDSFKYNSIDDILPMPSLVYYPFYTTKYKSYYKILSEDEAVVVEFVSISSKGVYLHNVEGNVKNWRKYDRITREQFIEKYYEAQKEMRSLIFNDIKSIVV